MGTFIMSLDKISTIESNRIIFDKVYILVSEQYKAAFHEFPDKNFLV